MKKGFTVIELLVVIAIIGLLSSIVLVALDLPGKRRQATLAKTLEFSQTIQSAIGDELVGSWTFENIENGKTPDMSGYNNVGTIYGATQVPGLTLASGVGTGKALSFDGTSNYVEVANSTVFNITQNGFTYATWIKPSSFPNSYNMFMGKYLPYFNVRSSRKLHMSMSAAGAQRSVYGDTSLNADTWYYAVATYDENGYMKVYLNGKQDGIAGPYLAPANYNYNFYIGQWRSNGSYRFTGFIDEVRIYGKALTLAEIQKQYAAGAERHKDLVAR